MKQDFSTRLENLKMQHNLLLQLKNEPIPSSNGILQRFKNPVLTAAHSPLYWRYDLDRNTNPFLIERFGINATLNAGAIKLNGKYLLVVRVEGIDRKSFFAVAESDNGVDNFKFWSYPVIMPEPELRETNMYDMRLTRHEDGWIYGLFCTESSINLQLVKPVLEKF